MGVSLARRGAEAAARRRSGTPPPTDTVIWSFDSTLQSWVGETGAVTRSTTTVHDGAGSLRVAVTTPTGTYGTMRVNDANTNTLVESAGNTLKAWVLIPGGSPGTNWRAHIEMQNSAFTWTTGPSTTLTAGSWAQVTYTPSSAIWTGHKGIGVVFECDQTAPISAVGYVDTIATSTVATGNFVTRNSTQLLLNGVPWYLYAGTVYGYSTPSSAVTQAQALNLNTIRITDWLDTNPTANIPAASTNATRWANVDALVAACAAAGLKAVLDLSCYRNLLEQRPSGGGNPTLNPYTVDWATFLTFVVNRVNTVNGKRYGDDDTFAFVEFGGEIEPPNGGQNTNGITTAQINAWGASVLTFWHNNAPGHLLTVGGLMQLWWASGVDYNTLWSHQYCDFANMHGYSGNDRDQGIPITSAWASAHGKPWLNEEFGYLHSLGDSTRAAGFNSTYVMTKSNGAAGVGIWNVGTGTADPTYDVNSSGPLTFAAVHDNSPLSTPVGTFLSKSGTQFVANGSAGAQLTGINVYGAVLSANLHGLSTLTTLFSSLGTPSAYGRGMLIRSWCFQRGSVVGGVRDWTNMDNLINAAKATGYKVIVVIANEGAADECPSVNANNQWWGPSGGSDFYRTAEWFQTGYKTEVEAEWTVTMKAWAVELATRYKNEPTIAMWEYINEAEFRNPTALDGTPAVTVLKNFCDDVGAAIQAVDPNHLRTMSVVGTGQYGSGGSDFQTLFSSTGLDVVQIHDYSVNGTTLPGDQFNGMALRIQQANANNKPVLIGECGNQVPSTEAPTTAARATLWQQKINTQFAAGIDGWVAWSYVNPPGGTPYDIGAGDPAIAVVFSNGSSSGSGATVPGAPTIGTATATGTTSASVTFTAPGSNGGAAIDVYRVTSSLGQATTGATSPIVISGLAVSPQTFTVAAHNSVGYGAASAASNSVTPAAPPALPVPFYGWTSDASSASGGSNANIIAACDALTALVGVKPFLRLVFDVVGGPTAAQYAVDVAAIAPHANIMACVVDSTELPTLTTAAYTQRYADFLTAMGNNITLWEIGNEVNGNWTGLYTDVRDKILGAFGVIHGAGKKSAITFYYNHLSGDGPGEPEVIPFIDTYLTDATLRANLDCATISWYETQSTPYRRPPITEFQDFFDLLRNRFPVAQTGFGEVGLPAATTTGTEASAQSILNFYYPFVITTPGYVGGYFWWYGRQDFLPITSGTEPKVGMWATFQAAIQSEKAAIGSRTFFDPRPETFESYPIGQWAQVSTHGPWFVQFNGGGVTQVLLTGGSQVLQIDSAVPTSAGVTASNLVTSPESRAGDFDTTISVRTTVQLRTGAYAGAVANAWEVGWFCWNFKRQDSTHVRFYYVALKATGFELGKVDQTVFTATGGQRFLWTDSTAFALNTWHTLRVSQTGSRIQVWGNGVLRADFTDGPGSTGTPAWGTAGETVFTDGGFGLYEEDARVQWDNLATNVVPPTTALSYFGIAGHASGGTDAYLNQLLDGIQGVGAKWVRLGADWSNIQGGGSSSYNWTDCDRWVAGCNARGLGVMFMCGYTPAWAGPIWNGPPTNDADFATFMNHLVTRYAPLGVKAYEIWNEMNIATFWTPNGVQTMARYASLLKAAYTAAKGVDPSITVITGGTSPASDNNTSGGSVAPVTWTTGLYSNGCKNFFDALGHHPYCYPAYASGGESWNAFSTLMPQMRTVMVNNGDSAKKIWGTEWGLPTGDSSWGGVTEAVQGLQETDAYNTWRGYAWTGPLFQHEFHDQGVNSADVEQCYGLTRNDWSHKPGWTSYNALTGGGGSGGGSGGVQLVQRVTNASATNVTTLTATLTSTATAGNTLIAYVGISNVGILNGTPATWTLRQSNGAGNANCYLFDKIAAGTETSLVVASSGAAGIAIIVEEWSGLMNPSTDVSANGNSSGTVTTVTATTATTTQVAEMVVACAVSGTLTTPTSASGMVIDQTRATSGTAGAISVTKASKTVAATGTQSTTFTWAAAVPGPEACIATYKINAVLVTQNIFTSQTPTGLNNNDFQPITCGTRFTSTSNGQVTGVRFYRASTAPVAPVGVLYSDAGTELARATFGTLTTGWNTVSFVSPVAVAAGAFYRVAYWSSGPYVNAVGGFPITNQALTADSGYFVYGGSPAFPTGAFGSDYFADAVFSTASIVYTIPDPPTGLFATAGDTTASISFTAPPNTGGGITDYTATSATGPSGVRTGSNATSPVTVTGLSNGTAYTFTVKANNSAGSSVASATSNSVTPAVSTAINIFTSQVPATLNNNDGQAIALSTQFVSARDGQITGMRFYRATTAPISAIGAIYSSGVVPMGSNVEMGRVSFTMPGSAGWNVANLATPIPITAGTTYYAVLWTSMPYVASAAGTFPVTNGDLTGSAGFFNISPVMGIPVQSGGNYFADVAFVGVTTLTVPIAPGWSVAAEGNGAAYVTWPKPTNTGGRAVTGYTITPYIGASAQTATTVGAVNSTTVTGLANGTTYTFKIAAITSVGTGAQSVATNAVTPVALPTGVTLTPIDGGPSYFTQWTGVTPLASASIIPVGVWLSDATNSTDIAFDQATGLNLYLAITSNSNAALVGAAGMQMWAQSGEWFSQQSSAITAWLLGDEVDMTAGPGWGVGQGFTIMQAAYNQVNGDGRMKEAGYGKGVLFWESEADAETFVNTFQSVTAADSYWISDPDLNQQSQGGALLGLGRALTDAERKRPSNYAILIDRQRIAMWPGAKKPVLNYVEVGAPGGAQPGDGNAYITPAQMRAAVWAGFIGEARGVVFFNHTFGTVNPTSNTLRDPNYATMRAAVQAVTSQLQTLAPVLNSPTALAYATATGNVRLIAKKALRGNSKFYVFAISTALTTDTSQSITFTLAGETNATITVEGESRTLSMSGGQFTDTFADSQAVHIYRVG